MKMNGIKPIETIYKGYRFRSRLEARWAVLLDALGAQWEYEPEGFDLGKGLKYLPDFRVHNVSVKGGEAETIFIEVKGELSGTDEIKIRRFAELVNNPVLVVGEIPNGNSAYELIYDAVGNLELSEFPSPLFSFELIDGDGYSCMLGTSENGDGLVLYGSDYTDLVDEKKTTSAYRKARQARFEHGEHGV